MIKKALALSLILLIFSAGCSRQGPDGGTPLPESSQPAQPSTSEPESSPAVPPENDPKTPEGAAQLFLDKAHHIERKDLEALVKQYTSTQDVPESYYRILEQIASRLSFKIGDSRINGNTAEVDVTVTSVDAQEALNSAIPGALAHLAALQIAGKDISSPEEIITDYAADNIEWGKISVIKTNTVMHLIKDANGNWLFDADNPQNTDFANAVSGGAIEMAQSLKSFAERFK